MFIYTLKFDRKRTAFAVIVAALLIIGIILMAGAHRKAKALGDGGGEARSAGSAAKQVTSVKTEKNRVAWLAQNGWEVESPAESRSDVVIPRTFSPVFETYNELQKRQGFDLSQYCGEEVTMYTYRVTNAEADPGETVLAVLYVLNGRVIGGDVHSTALDGFMVPVKQ